MAHVKITPRTLSLYITGRGAAFVCFIHPRMVIDWGTKYVRSGEKDANTLRVAKQLIDQFGPTAIVIENVEDSYSKRGPRIKTLCRAIAKYGERKQIAVHAYSRRETMDAFASAAASNKHDLNCIIVSLLPTLRAWQPRKRRAFDPELSGQGMFDAAALGLTFYVRINKLDVAQAMQEEQVDDLSL